MISRWRKVEKGGESFTGSQPLHHHPFIGWRVVVAAKAARQDKVGRRVVNSPGDLREWKRHWRLYRLIAAQRRAAEAVPRRVVVAAGAVVVMPSPPLPRLPIFPANLRGFECGARTRAGTSCKRRDVWENGRCKLHGGLSTGPKSEEGKSRALGNLKKRWRGSEPHEGLSKLGEEA